jgi:hypothetical protein
MICFWRHTWGAWSIKEEGTITRVDEDGIKRVKGNYIIQHRTCVLCGFIEYHRDTFGIYDSL